MDLNEHSIKKSQSNWITMDRNERNNMKWMNIQIKMEISIKVEMKITLNEYRNEKEFK